MSYLSSAGRATRPLTIDELAAATGTTTRRIRSFQTLGLLPHPELRGRTGLYGPTTGPASPPSSGSRTAGFSLESLGVLFAALEAGRSLADVLGVARRLAVAGPPDPAVGPARRRPSSTASPSSRRAAPRRAAGGPPAALRRAHHGVGRERGLRKPAAARYGRAVPEPPPPPAALGGGGDARRGGGRHHPARRRVARRPTTRSTSGCTWATTPSDVATNRTRAAAAFGVDLDDHGLRPPGARHGRRVVGPDDARPRHAPRGRRRRRHRHPGDDRRPVSRW